MNELSDDELVCKAKNGDINAFTQLGKRYQEKIYWTILAMTKNHEDTNDLAQETFLQAFRSLKRFKQQSSFYTWIYRIATNLTLNFLKKSSKEKYRKELSPEQEPTDDSFNATSQSPEKKSLRKELRNKLDEALDALPIVYRISFILVEFQDMSHGQAARILKCSENTVSWRMHKARKMLQARLLSYLERG
ncbi:MAG: sigma-70 family RNA polymerase sigma factor [Candidatus Aminicenantes bacterium]|nr:sigma-70 family RNA polymerase sigma factor [Candidatus Aminicenantes bacterium]